MTGLYTITVTLSTYILQPTITSITIILITLTGQTGGTGIHITIGIILITATTIGGTATITIGITTITIGTSPITDITTTITTIFRGNHQIIGLKYQPMEVLQVDLTASSLCVRQLAITHVAKSLHVQ